MFSYFQNQRAMLHQSSFSFLQILMEGVRVKLEHTRHHKFIFYWIVTLFIFEKEFNLNNSV